MCFYIEFSFVDFFRTGISSFTFSGSGTQVFPVGIVDDDEVEGDESFTITLTNPRPDGVVLNPDRMIITIRANDRECLVHPLYLRPVGCVRIYLLQMIAYYYTFL